MNGPVSIGTGSQGQRANSILLQRRTPLEPRLIHLAPGLWTIFGLSIANCHVIDAGEALVVVDTGNSVEEGCAIRERIRGISAKPIGAVIYTHSHYIHGTTAVLEGETNNVTIVAHANLPGNMAAAGNPLAPLIERRHRAQYGTDLPDSGPDAATSRPSFYHGQSGYVPPNLLIARNGEEFQVAGLRCFALTEYPFDTSDCLILWLPEHGAVVHNHLTGNFPNVYSISGGRFRDPNPWIAGLTRMMQFEPEHLLGVHGLPISGRDQCRERIGAARDALQFLVDEVVRGLNNGLTADELAALITLPAELAHHPFLQQTYGEVAHHVRAICSGLIGWFDGDPVNLHAVPPAFESQQIVEGFGGCDQVLARVRDALAAEQWAWAAKLARHAVRATPGHSEAKKLLAQALRELGYRSTAWSTRNYCLTHARLLEAEDDARH